MKLPKFMGLLIAAGISAACSNSGESKTAFQHFSVDGDNILVHSVSAPDAVVSINGNLIIAGKTIALTPVQQDWVNRYRAGVVSLHENAAAAGMAGAATGGQPIKSVFAGLASGQPEKIGDGINAKAAKIDVAVAKICASLAEIRTTQDAIAAQLVEFKPYASIDGETVANCRPKR